MAARATKTKIVVLAAVVSVALLTLGPTPAKAETYVFSLDTLYGKSTPSSTFPWLTASFQDIDVGQVQLTLTSSLEDSDEFIRAFAFNIKDSIDPSSVSITQDTSKLPLMTSISTGAQNSIKNFGGSTGDGFDFLISWDSTNGADRFGGTGVNVFNFVFTGLQASDFLYANTGTAQAYVAVKIQLGNGKTAYAESTDYVTVPEPELIVLLGFGLGAIALFKRRWLS
jgi:hypothetical protein